MKFIHLSDLHIGKRLNGFSLIEDQEAVLSGILKIVRAEAPDAVLIAGDVYDRPVPGADAVRLFDRFLTALAETRTEIFIISGNHDSSERLSFGSRLMASSGVHFAPVYDGSAIPYIFEDAYGETAVYMLPFIKPAEVRRFFPEQEIVTYSDAVRAAVGAMAVEEGRRNVLISHQFVTGALRSESEEVTVGGIDNVDAEVYAPFDYVALGHLHGPQQTSGRPGQILRYAGTPLKYSFSEKDQQKSVTFVELFEKTGGNTRTEVRTVPLAFPHDMREIRGSYEELTARNNYAGTQTEDYLSVTLTDEEDIPDALNRLRVIYPNIMKLQYDNTRTRNGVITGEAADPEETDPKKLFAAFFKEQNGKELNEKQAAAVNAVIEKIFGEEAE